MIVWETIRFVFVDVAWGIVRFPVWWYTTGFLKVIHSLRTQFGGLVQSLNIKILVRYLLKPMFGQYDIWGRIISFVMRMVQLVFLLVVAAVVVATLTVLAVVWLLLPPFVLYNILFHLQLFDGLSRSYLL